MSINKWFLEYRIDFLLNTALAKILCHTFYPSIVTRTNENIEIETKNS